MPAESELGTEDRARSVDTVDYRPIDQRIWEEELEDFVPASVIDAHAHYLLDVHLPEGHPLKGTRAEENLDTHRAWAKRLYPGRDVRFQLIAWPLGGIDVEAHNAGLAAEARREPGTPAAMLVTPDMTAEKIAVDVTAGGFCAIKPYRFFSITGDIDGCRITDFLPEHQIEVADDMGLRIILHLAKRAACADEENLADLTRLTGKYPRAKWQLAHCARAFTPWIMERAIDRLRDMPNICYDLSAVGDVSVFWILFTKERVERILYGSDGIEAGFARGRYFTFGRGWTHVCEEDLKRLNTAHCEAEPTLVVYESLRAIRRAADMAGLTAEDVEMIFAGNARNQIMPRDP